ncbi:hypothetical protein [Spirosoma endbachense]|uniref:Zinc-finger domain-containing protein n=1 Tax=Spirosoma endbachense TaxID=2666025 RepID=A0A6P1VRX0_9BACT|nr:hypothetical protein [Spirosoma endbachense]QHV95374.1 hypothetical protein GJR95_10290 [Spirosoma endbachense]
MSKTHLSDSEVQQYVFHTFSCSEQLIDHITHCEDCRRKAQLYSVLLDGVNQQNRPVFEFSLSGLVMGQLPPAKTKNSFDNVFIFCLITSAVFLVCIVFYRIGSDLFQVVSTITPMVVYLLYTIASFSFLFLCVAMYVEFQRKMKTLHFS